MFILESDLPTARSRKRSRDPIDVGPIRQHQSPKGWSNGGEDKFYVLLHREAKRASILITQTTMVWTLSILAVPATSNQPLEFQDSTRRDAHSDDQEMNLQEEDLGKARAHITSTSPILRKTGS